MTSSELRIKQLIDAIHNRRFCDNTGCATDEEVRFFIETFMVPTTYYNRRMTSYSLKHICERVVGYLFRCKSDYAYTSNDQFKRICAELYYKHRDADREGVNWYIGFHFATELKGIMELYNQHYSMP